MAAITIDSVTKRYPNECVAVSGVSLDIDDGEFLVLVGPSGCGKSTLLRMIAGLEKISEGEITIGGRVVNDVSPKDRNVAMVFQNYALYPHMTVARNISYALRISKVSKPEINRRVGEVARILELEEVLDNKPAELSGGQRQRVAMGRAIIREPAVYLMDEPLSNLDAKLRVQTRAEITRLQRRLGVTTVYVTHDQVEAMTMGSRVAVLKEGVIQQVDPPQDLYDHPVNQFVASFIGSPSMNQFIGRLNADVDGGVTVRLGPNELRVPRYNLADPEALARFVGQDIVVGIRPEAFYDPDLQPERSASQMVAATVDLVEALGADLLVHVRIDAVRASVNDSDREQPAVSAAGPDDSGLVSSYARLTPRSRLRVGDRTSLGVDVAALHFFDPVTHSRIQC